MTHHQVITVILDLKGNNTYLDKKGKVHFGIQIYFYASLKNSGVKHLMELEFVREFCEETVPRGGGW